MINQNRGTPLEVVYNQNGEIAGWVCPACSQFVNGAVEHECPVANNQLYYRLDRISNLLYDILIELRSN